MSRLPAAPAEVWHSVQALAGTRGPTTLSVWTDSGPMHAAPPATTAPGPSSGAGAASAFRTSLRAWQALLLTMRSAAASEAAPTCSVPTLPGSTPPAAPALPVWSGTSEPLKCMQHLSLQQPAASRSRAAAGTTGSAATYPLQCWLQLGRAGASSRCSQWPTEDGPGCLRERTSSSTCS